MRTLDGGMDGAAIAEIDGRLAAIARDYNVAIPLAIESGSRAWGFPSPDSDYDCRFIFIRSRRDYLSLWPQRDVIETPLDNIFDVNGWDVAKAIKLLVKGNAVVIEWLTSPIVYGGDSAFCADFLELARAVTERSSIARHYRSLMRAQCTTIFGGSETPIKKLFYALRPAMALRWLRLNPQTAVAPMHFPTLMMEADLPPPLTKTIAQMLVRKAATRELGTGPVEDGIAAFLRDEDERAGALCAEATRIEPSAARNIANAFFIHTVEKFGPHRE